ncbi:MAG: prolyl oligopeptidase family serine peptidase, partial [Myxococcales bacterium]|nr:prolyl oligopeptidase family serine peptidase [Myxococcales bacterium]
MSRALIRPFSALLGSCALSLGLACAPPNAAKPYPSAAPPGGDAGGGAGVSAGSVRYFDRTVDLEPFLVGFPYQDFTPSLETGTLFFLETGDQYTLRALDIPAEAQRFDLTSARALSDVDWSQRSLWGLEHQPSRNLLWLHADARNDEQMNLWTLDLGTGVLAQVTQHDYVYGFGFDERRERIAYLPRAGTKAPYRSCLNVLDTATLQSREIVCDTPELTFTWSHPRFSPEGDEVFFSAQVEGDRNRVQLVSVKLQDARPRVRVITDPKVSRSSPRTLKGWLDGDTLLFTANDDGYANLYSYARKGGAIRQLTRFKEDITSAALVDAGVFAVHRTPRGSTLVIVDPRTGKVLGEVKRPGTADVLDGHKGQVLWSQRAPDVVFEANLADVEPGAPGQGPGLKNRTVIALPPALEQQIVACQAETVTIPTFDRDPATGRIRELHAFVLHPRRPLDDPSRRLAILTAFYGGNNQYSTFNNVMCAAGLTVVSASVRGSAGFGKEFYGLNDKDLGGDEIVDLFYVARWAEKKLGLTSAQIGVQGGSHGGFATMRAMTFPPETGGRNDSYPFGFGMSHAGFSDIKTFYDATNIPDWVVLESGDPGKPAELARMKDRSPLTHVARLNAPLLVTHGENDWRVPVAESRQFVEAAKALGRPVTYVEFPGQGHRIEGLARVVELYQASFDFLSRVARAAGARPVESPSGQVSQPAPRAVTSPSGQPAPRPVTSPSGQPAARPVTSPSGQPAPRPVTSPSGQPAPRPVTSPSGQPAPRAVTS